MKQLILFSAIALMMAACSSSEKRMIKGYEVLTLVEEDGPTPEINDFVHFHLYIYDDKDEMLQNMQEGGNIPVIQVLPDEQVRDAGNPVIDLMKQLSIGDSVMLVIPKDSIPTPTAQMSNTEYVKYAVVPKMIHSEEEYKAYNEGLVAEDMGAAKTAVKDYMDGNFDGRIVDLEDGMKIYIIEDGEGEHPTIGQMVSVDYAGFLKDMTNFDNSYKRGRAYTFPIGQGRVIKGWDLGIPFFKPGGKGVLDIPWSLAYGKAGSPPTIPGESDLLFYVELKAIN